MNPFLVIFIVTIGVIIILTLAGCSYPQEPVPFVWPSELLTELYAWECCTKAITVRSPDQLQVQLIFDAEFDVALTHREIDKLNIRAMRRGYKIVTEYNGFPSVSQYSLMFEKIQ